MSAPHTAPARPDDGPPLPRAVRLWAPVGAWLVVIAFTSGDVGARAHMDVWVWRLFNEWLPALLGLEPSTGGPSFLPWWVRKLAHVVEYGVLGLLVVRAQRVRRGAHRRAGAPGAGATDAARDRWAGLGVGVALSAGVAILDEIHQGTLPSRTGSPRDVALDVVGATVGALIGSRLWVFEESGDLGAVADHVLRDPE